MPNSKPPAKIPFWEVFRFWLKLGFISFGGPAGQISMMHQELVEKRRWLSEGRFLHALNYCMVLPGPEAQQLATYIGWLMHRTRGGIVAGVLFVLPSLFILIALSWIYIAYGNTTLVAGLFFGIKPAVTAIVLHAAWRIGSRALKTKLLWAIAGAAFVAIFAFGTPFPAIVMAAGLIGYVAGRMKLVRTESHGQPEKNAKIKCQRSSTTIRRRPITPVSPGRGSCAWSSWAPCSGCCPWRCSRRRSAWITR